MKPNKTVDRIERALWNAGRSSAPFAGSADWQDGVMAAIRRIGPLEAKSPVRLYEPAVVWPWAAAVAACLAIVIAGYALSGMNTDAVMAGLFWDDPAGLTVNNMILAEM
ncbi:MAG: hypothetical protein WC381_04715 [Kiritimatiellia bacterium]|jgi:hypothetical protein